MTLKLKEELAQEPLENQLKEKLEIAEALEQLVRSFEETDPQLVTRIFSRVTPEAIAASLSPEQRNQLLKLLLQQEKLNETQPE